MFANLPPFQSVFFIRELNRAKDAGLQSTDVFKSFLKGRLFDPNDTGFGLIYMRREVDGLIDDLTPQAPQKPPKQAIAVQAQVVRKKSSKKKPAKKKATKKTTGSSSSGSQAGPAAS